VVDLEEEEKRKRRRRRLGAKIGSTFKIILLDIFEDTMAIKLGLNELSLATYLGQAPLGAHRAG